MFKEVSLPDRHFGTDVSINIATFNSKF